MAASTYEIEIYCNESKDSALDEGKSAFQLNFERELCDFYAGHVNSSHNVKKPWTSGRIAQVSFDNFN